MPGIKLTPDANGQFSALVNFYKKKIRPAAVLKLYSTLDHVADPDNLPGLRFFDAPRPYPRLRIAGVTWTTHNGYWFGFDLTHPIQIVAIIYGSADFMRQTRHLRRPATPKTP